MPNLSRLSFVAAFALMALAACSPPASQESAQEEDEYSSFEASDASDRDLDSVAIQTSRYSPNVRCPARIASPARPANQPVNDIVGVRPNLTVSEAHNLVLCEDRTLQVQDREGVRDPNTPISLNLGFGAVSYNATGSGTVSSADIRNSFAVSAMGAPNQERVYRVTRRQTFDENERPTVERLRAALVSKYGPPSEMRGDDLVWVYDQSHQLQPAGSQLLERCSGLITRSNGFSNFFEAGCGIMIQARIIPRTEAADVVGILLLHVLDNQAYIRLDQEAVAHVRAHREREANSAREQAEGNAAPDL